MAHAVHTLFQTPVPGHHAPRCPAPGHVAAVGPGSARIVVERVQQASAVVACASASPLRLLVPIPRGAAAWAVAASHGGGLVAGDALELAIEVRSGAALALLTQAETKIYRRAPGAAPARQRLRAAIAPGALLALLPDPVSPYAGASYAQEQTFDLAPGASLLYLDAVTAGRAARGERWAFERHVARSEVRLDGRTVLADGLRLVAGEGSPVAERLRGIELLATVVAVGPAVAAGARAILEVVSGAPVPGPPARVPPPPLTPTLSPRFAGGEGDGSSVLLAASPLADGVILRIAAATVEDGMAAVRRHLAFAAPLLGGDPLSRRP